MSIVLEEENYKKSDRIRDSKLWKISRENVFYHSEEVTKTLPSGVFSIYKDKNGEIFFKKQKTSFDEILTLPDSTSDEIVKEIEAFWTKKKKFTDMNFLWKRGIMLYGPPGSGKTCTIQLICEKINKKDGISIYVDDPYVTADGLKVLRIIEPDRPVVVIFEDIDSMIDNYGEAEILSVLDGQVQIDNVVFIATTNYPEKLNERIINRPSRFDIVKEIGFPSAASRKIFLEIKNPRLKEVKKELDMWVDKTDNLSIAHLKEIVILVEIFGKSFDEALIRVKGMANFKSSDKFGGKGRVGFTAPK